MDRIKNPNIESALSAACPVTSLPILRKTEWTDVTLGKDYRFTVSIVGDNILLSQARGRATLNDIKNALRINNQAVTEAIGGNCPFIQIEDLTNFSNLSREAREYYIDFMKNRERFLGLIFYGASPLLKLSIKLGRRLNIAKFDVYIVDDYSEAVKLALKILSTDKIREDKPAIAYFDVKPFVKDILPPTATGKEFICPVTALPITTKPEWTDIDIAENYSVSFSLIGNAILHTTPDGVPSDTGTHNLLEEREKVLRETNLLGKKYAEIRDHSRLSGKPSRESRMMLTNLLVKETNEGNLIGFWVFNAPLYIKWMFNVGTKLYKPSVPVVAVRDYKTAVQNAVKVLDENGIDVGARQYKRFTKDDWNIELENYGVRFELVGDDTIYSTAQGSLREAYVEKFFNLHEKVLNEAGLMEKGYYYRILNWEKLEKTTWKARKMYIDGLKALNETVPCNLSVLFGLNKLMSKIVGISKQFVPVPITTADNLEEALAIIEREKNKEIETRTTKKGKKVPEKIYREEKTRKYSDELLKFVGAIDWDQKGLSSENISDSHPFKPVFDAIAIIKGDVDDLFHDCKRAEDSLRESEQKYRSLITNIPDITWRTDINRNTIFISPNIEKVYGYSPEEIYKVGDELWFGRIHHDDVDRVKESFERLFTEGTKLDIEYRVQRKDGKWIWLHDRSTGTLEENGVKFADGIFSDITDRKQAEEERAKLETQLLQAQKMEAIGTLVGGVAHDLNNILSGIISYPELLLMDLPENSPLRKPLLTIKSSGEKAAVVVQDLLTLARRGVTITEIVNLNSIISEQLKSPECENLKSFHPDVDIKTNLEKDLLNIKGSTAHLSKTVMNLTSNAAEAMPDGGKIFISTENLYIDRPIRGYDQVAEGDYVTVTVSDTGIGISGEDMNRIFEPFYTKKVMGRSGTGLGMAVVWGTVKDHNGYIDVESTEGKARPPRLSESDPPALQARALRAGGGQGTTFTLYFPVIRQELAIDKSLFSIEDYMGKGESILIVDDVKEQREIASVILKKLGYSVTSVSSGEEAIEYMKDNSADLLVLDMIMDPGIDGLDTYKKILELYPKQKAIIASGFSETDRVKKAKKLGAGAYVKKPYVLEKIGLVIKEELEKGKEGRA